MHFPIYHTLCYCKAHSPLFQSHQTKDTFVQIYYSCLRNNNERRFQFAYESCNKKKVSLFFNLSNYTKKKVILMQYSLQFHSNLRERMNIENYNLRNREVICRLSCEQNSFDNTFYRSFLSRAIPEVF